MATYKEIIPSDITVNKSQLNQLIYIVQEDVSGSTTRKKIRGICNWWSRSWGDIITFPDSL